MDGVRLVADGAQTLRRAPRSDGTIFAPIPVAEHGSHHILALGTQPQTLAISLSNSTNGVNTNSLPFAPTEPAPQDPLVMPLDTFLKQGVKHSRGVVEERKLIPSIVSPEEGAITFPTDPIQGEPRSRYGAFGFSPQ
eukprot:8958528-Pyramimonas_sp.AAC.1